MVFQCERVGDNSVAARENSESDDSSVEAFIFLLDNSQKILSKVVKCYRDLTP